MTGPEIKFGTDGWRGIIADTYTFENLRRVAEATVRWVLETGHNTVPQVVIGYDCRFMSEDFAQAVAEVFANRGIKAIISSSFTGTPSVSWAATAYNCDAGIVITASHNPPQYNGFKIKSHYGGPASPGQIAQVEQHLAGINGEISRPKTFDTLVNDGLVEWRDVRSGYLDMMHSSLDIGAIRESGLRIAYDAMFGSGQGMVTDLVGADHVIEVHHDHNPGFHGTPPEPIEKNLRELARVVVEEGCDVGIATDGDADRIAMYDENGEYVDSHRLLSLLLKYLVTQKGLRGDVVKTFSATDLLNKMADAYDLKLHVTPVGFKYIAEKIMDGDVLVGGEESGGMAVKGHIPERDGVYIGLLIVEMMVKRGKKLSELVQELFDEFGAHIARRRDLHTTQERKHAFLKFLQTQELSDVDGRPVLRVETVDGFKYYTEDGWLMFRASGTEPVLRVYSESASARAAERLIETGARMIEDLAVV